MYFRSIQSVIWCPYHLLASFGKLTNSVSNYVFVKIEKHSSMSNMKSSCHQAGSGKWYRMCAGLLNLMPYAQLVTKNITKKSYFHLYTKGVKKWAFQQGYNAWEGKSQTMWLDNTWRDGLPAAGRIVHQRRLCHDHDHGDWMRRWNWTRKWGLGIRK